MANLPGIPGALNVPAPLTGLEIIPLGIGSPVSAQTTAAAIAALASGVSNANVATTVSTVGAATLSAAAIYGRTILRTGTQTAAWTDTTDTAAAIIAKFPASAAVGTSFTLRYVNLSAGANGFPVTIANGSNVTITGATVVPPQSFVEYLVTWATATTVTMVATAQGYFPSLGTVTANAATPVPVTNAAMTPGSQVVLTYKSGTQGATGAFVSSATAGTGFSIKSVTSDTAVYNYAILG